MRGGTSNCCYACGISAQSILKRISAALSYILSDLELCYALHNGSLSESHKVALATRLCLESIRGDIISCSIDRNILPSRTNGGGLESKYDNNNVDVTDDRRSFDGRQGENESSSDSTSTECSSSDDTESTGSISEKGNQHFKGNVRWSKLEKERLRVYVGEKKSWTWIARKLGRTEAAVRMRWSLINR